MKKMFFSLIFAASIISCGGSPKAVGDFKNTDWKLVEVLIDNKNINFNRKDLANEKAGDIFTMKFDAENISGVGAPNRYSAPYTVDGKNLSIMPVRATQMASIWQPEKLKEFEFFQYIQNISEWALVEGKLELSSKTADGKAVKMIFSL